MTNKIIPSDEALQKLVDDLTRPFLVVWRRRLDKAMDPRRDAREARIDAVNERLKALQIEISDLKNQNMNLQWRNFVGNQHGS